MTWPTIPLWSLEIHSFSFTIPRNVCLWLSCVRVGDDEARTWSLLSQFPNRRHKSFRKRAISLHNKFSNYIALKMCDEMWWWRGIGENGMHTLAAISSLICCHMREWMGGCHGVRVCATKWSPCNTKYTRVYQVYTWSSKALNVPVSRPFMRVCVIYMRLQIAGIKPEPT